MPGYMMHLCESEYILRRVTSIHGDLFRLGSVLPDAVTDKAQTHFHSSWQKDLITKYPDMSWIINKYPVCDMTAADLGALAHLHLDSLYVERFWPQFFRFEASDNRPTCVTSDIDHVRMTSRSMQPADTLIPFKVFFSEEYFYGDYNVTNPVFMSDFSPSIPEVKEIDLSIAECRAFSPQTLRADLEHFISCPAPPDGGMTRVFPYEELKQFIISSADEFIHEYIL